MNDELADEDPHGPGADARICTQSDVAARYEQHHERLRKAAGRYFQGKRPDLVDEAIGIVFAHLMDLVEKGKLTDKDERWGGYLRRMVLNCCVDLVRREIKFRNTFPEGDPEKPRIIDHDPLGDDISDDDLARRRQARLDEALANLSERQVTIVRHVLEGWTNKQIGEELGISGQAVGQQLRTILNQLHEEVTKDEWQTQGRPGTRLGP